MLGHELFLFLLRGERRSARPRGHEPRLPPDRHARECRGRGRVCRLEPRRTGRRIAMGLGRGKPVVRVHKLGIKGIDLGFFQLFSAIRNILFSAL